MQQGSGRISHMAQSMISTARFRIGQVVRHRFHPFRGVVFDVDPEFGNTDEWWEAIPEESRPRKDQPFYHLLAENETSYYHAYVSEQNLVPDETGDPVDHPQVNELFGDLEGGQYEVEAIQTH
jgi:heat shock protein HspQ